MVHANDQTEVTFYAIKTRFQTSSRWVRVTRNGPMEWLSIGSTLVLLYLPENMLIYLYWPVKSTNCPFIAVVR